MNVNHNLNPPEKPLEKIQKLRSICVEIIKHLISLMKGKLSNSERLQISSDLERISGQLIELGVNNLPRFPDNSNWADPLVMAQFIAKDLYYREIAKDVVTEDGARAILEELNLYVKDGAEQISAVSNIDERVVDLFKRRATINVYINRLSITDDELA